MFGVKFYMNMNQHASPMAPVICLPNAFPQADRKTTPCAEAGADMLRKYWDFHNACFISDESLVTTAKLADGDIYEVRLLALHRTRPTYHAFDLPIS